MCSLLEVLHLVKKHYWLLITYCKMQMFQFIVIL